MRVLQVDAGREWRGGQNQVRLLCRALAETPGVTVHLATRRDGELARRAAAEGVEVRGLRWAAGLDPRALFGLQRESHAFHPDVVHAHDSHALQLALWARTLAGLSAPVLGTRRVDFHVGRHSPWRHADVTIAISQAVRSILAADGFRATAIPIVPDGIDPAEVRKAGAIPWHVRERLGLPAGTPLAVNVAALVEHKDHDTLLRAAAAAAPHRPDLHWAIAGAGPRRTAIGAAIAHLDLAHRVHLLGYVPEADALIREASVFVLSSREEGLGSVVLNALALGTPVVATAAGGIPEVLPPAALVPVGDADALAGAVLRALEEPLRVPLPDRFTATAMARGVLDVYRTLL